ncbi:uromodulin-like 1 [Chanos chanos]|uniref:Uromodulin-like 1 n=1 Tax=Chanos chanos TaxID=29144 RepID=A0A6J2WUZ1_CHACN|nr:uromodulin-like 1 [Chanos chanos]
MDWVIFACLVSLFHGFGEGHNTLYNGYDLSLSGYHLCEGVEPMLTSSVISYKTPYTQRRSCGGWLPWRTCEVTLYKIAYRTEVSVTEKQVTRCCSGFVQVGSYCALPLNRSAEFTAKPGLCPTHDMVDMSSCTSECEWDTDCPGLQKCCQINGVFRCSNALPSIDRGSCFNLTITLKMEYQHLVAMDSGILNHTRLLHSVVTGALISSVISVHHVESWPAGVFTTSSSLLIGSPTTLTLSDLSSKLHLLIERVEEVTAVNVEDVDECASAELNSCPPHSDCVNTEGSYTCTCLPGFTDQNTSLPGLLCQDEIPSITNLASFNVTGSSFCLSWTVQSQSGHTFQVVVQQGSALLNTFETTRSSLEISQLQPGVLYTVCITPSDRCGNQGITAELRVRTAAQTLAASARLTNVVFNDSMQNPESEEFKQLSWMIQNEIRLSLPPDIQQLVDSGQVRVEITRLSRGSVVVDFRIVFMPTSTQNTMSVSAALMGSLLNSTRLSVDRNITIQDLNECSLNDTDCSRWADCVNTMGSYTCVCRDGFTDSNPSVPGRVCTGPLTSPMTGSATSMTNTTSNTVNNSPTSTFANPLTSATINALTSAVSDSTTNTINSTLSNAVTIVLNNSVGNDTINSMTDAVTNTTAVTSTVTAALESTNRETTIPLTSNVTTVTIPEMANMTTASVTNTATAPEMTNRTAALVTTTATAPEMTNRTAALVTTTATSISTTAPLISHAEAIAVECRAGSIAVTVTREFLTAKQITEACLYLGQPECGVRGGNTTHVLLTVAWDECGTVLIHNETHNFAQVTLYNNMSMLASAPTVRLQVPIICTYRNSIIISTGYSPSGPSDMIKDVVAGSGTFHVTVRLLNGTTPLPQNYTLSPEEEVVVEVAVNSTLSQIKMVINKCWATSTNDPLEPTNYVFLENSCPVPNAFTTVLQNGNSSRSLLSVRIFSFVDLSVIYLHCQIQICIESAVATCLPVSSPKLDFVVNKETADGLNTVGAILLGLGLCLFCAVGIAGLLYHRRKIGTYNFRINPKQENFTYNVFET